MNQLNPTLWRTCKMLAGRTRLRLLRLVLEDPERHVSTMAELAGIGESGASQELRRLQSRGLLKRVRRGAAVLYHPVPDPQVPTAAPLLKALRAAFSEPEPEETGARIAMGLAHERRIHLVRLLQQKPLGFTSLLAATGMSATTLQHHLRFLREGDWIQRTGRKYALKPAKHPLAHALAKLLRSA